MLITAPWLTTSLTELCVEVQADAESNVAAQSVMQVLKDSQLWLQEHTEEEEGDTVARVTTCMSDERLPLQEKQNLVQASCPTELWSLYIATLDSVLSFSCTLIVIYS